MSKTKKWSVTKEEALIAAIISVNNLCHDLGLAELIPMEAAKVILTASRERGVEAVREFAARITARSLSKLIH